MSIHKRAGIVLLALAAVAAAACNGDDAFTPDDVKVPTAFTIVSGNSQTATTGVALASPLVVSVTDQDGKGIPDLKVGWVVTSGAGTLGADSTSTDANGDTQNTFTPTAAGSDNVRAGVDGATDVTFTFTAASGG